MTSAFNSSNIQHMLQTDIASCEALLALLNEERDALKSRDHDRIDNIIQAKALHLQHLEGSAQTRTQWALASKNGKVNPETVWHDMLAEQGAEIKTQWESLKNLLSDCRRENEINGKILSRNQKTFSRLVSILRGQTAGTNLYTSKGSRNAHLPGHQIGEA